MNSKKKAATWERKAQACIVTGIIQAHKVTALETMQIYSVQRKCLMSFISDCSFTLNNLKDKQIRHENLNELTCI